jgi:hypothetical protein
MPMSDYLRRQYLRHLLGVEVYTPPTTIYLQLFTGDPTPAGTGPAMAVARMTSTWVPPTADTSALAATLRYAGSPAEATITHAAQYDALTGGNMLLYGELNDPITVAAGTEPEVRAGELTAFFT